MSHICFAQNSKRCSGMQDLARVTSDHVKLKATCEEKDTLLLKKQKEVCA